MPANLSLFKVILFKADSDRDRMKPIHLKSNECDFEMKTFCEL